MSEASAAPSFLLLRPGGCFLKAQVTDGKALEKNSSKVVNPLKLTPIERSLAEFAQK